VIFPEKLRSFSDYCFSGCENLQSIRIPSLIKVIPNGCFKGCTSLVSIVFLGKILHFREDCFEGCLSLQNISISLKLALPPSSIHQTPFNF
jgi:hypothetical protein